MSEDQEKGYYAANSQPICFIHVDKTGGTSFYKTVLEPNCGQHLRLSNIVSWRRSNADLLSGHMPYLPQWVLRKKVNYVTMLRDPVDRAISWYYFITEGIEHPELFKGHPLRRIARNMTIVEFYEDARFSNIQARFLAGYVYHKMYPFMYKSAIFKRLLLQSAKRNLERCSVFGLQCRFEESVRLAESVFRWSGKRAVGDERHRASDRLSLAEIESRAPHVLPRLRELHKLDYELYSHAEEIFEVRLRKYGIANETCAAEC